MIRMKLPVSSHLRGWTALHQAATRLGIGDHDNALRIEHLRGFGHEPDAAERDDVARELPSLARQLQTVPDRVRQVLNLGVLIMMRKNNSMPGALEFQNLFRNGRDSKHRGGAEISRY